MQKRIDTQGMAIRDEWLRHVAALSADEVWEELGTRRRGLTPEEVEESREQHGSNEVGGQGRDPLPIRILRAFAEPFQLILIVIAIVSTLTDVVFVRQGAADPATPLIIMGMVIISAVMKFVQEESSEDAAEALARSIQNTTLVERSGAGRRELPLAEVVVGDVIHLSAGDIVPADLRIVSAHDLFVGQSSITGESVPLERYPFARDTTCSVADLEDICLMGATVVSGTAIGVAVAVGASTVLGGIATSLSARTDKTASDRGIGEVSMLLVRLMLVMAPIVLVANGLTKGDWLDALLFALSVAVGLTPEMLPMIMTSCMAKGATALSREKVIVKRLDAIQDLGVIDVLCTDKTGTLTEDRVVLERYLDVNGRDDLRVLGYAFLNSFFETGLRNLIDSAIIARAAKVDDLDVDDDAPTADELAEDYHVVDEIPFDFERRMVSVVVGDDEGHTSMITKGAVEEVLRVCTLVELDDDVVELTDAIEDRVMEHAVSLAEQGMRVLGVARKESPAGVAKLTADDESGMVLIGYLAFLDPPKESAAQAIRTLAEHGVTTKVLTGDSGRVAAHVCRAIGIEVNEVLDGMDVDALDDLQLADVAERATVFAKLSPGQKARVIQVLRERGHTVGYMGDGVNDAQAMRVSDCGISVDTAADVAKEAADIILLEKDLMVLERGIVEGRHTFANMLKYLKMTASSNFGNILTVLVASAFLPFLPMEAPQLLLLNFVYDVSCTAIPWDDVDEDVLRRPAVWDTGGIKSFMKWFGPVSSFFDVVTFALLFFVACPLAAGAPWGELASEQARFVFEGTFQTGWFVESMLTQVLVVHLIRTSKKPFLESRAAASLTALGIGASLVALAVPYTFVGQGLDLLPMPPVAYAWVLAVVLGYALVILVVRRLYMWRHGSLT